MQKKRLLIFPLFLTCATALASGVGVGSGISTSLDAIKAAGIAKNLANPIANMIAVPIQYDFDRGIGLGAKGQTQTLTLQPVVPFNLGSGNNFIVRPIVPTAWQNDVNGFSGTGVGNVQLETFFVPKSNSSLIWGVGPYLISPSGGNGQFGPKQTGAGITAVGLTQAGPWTAGLLVVRSWAISGSDTYGTVNNLYTQPFLSYRTKDNWTFGAELESTFNYNARRTSNQVLGLVSKLVMVGDQPISIAAGPKYNVSGVPGGPQGWGAQASVTFIFSK